MPIEESTGAPAEDTPTGGAGAVGGEPTAATASGEPVAPEPVAAPEAPAPDPFPSYEEFGWDTWDGTPDTLPENEHLRGWYGKFNDRHTQAAAEFEKRVSEAEADSNTWKSMYNAAYQGQEDPRIDELTNSAVEWETKYGEQLAEYEAYKADTEAYAQAQTDTYLSWVAQQHGTLLEEANASEEAKAAVFSLIDADIQLHNSLQIWKLGEEAVAKAVELAGKNVPEDDVIDFVQAKYGTAAPAPQARPKPSPAASIVSGSTPVAPNTPTAPKAISGTPRDRRLAAAQKALGIR
jgi:hypothetical protein